MKFSAAISVILLSCAVVTSNAQDSEISKSRLFLRKQEEEGRMLDKVSGEEAVRHLVGDEDEAEAEAADANEEDAEDDEPEEEDAEEDAEEDEDAAEDEEEEDENAYGGWSNNNFESYKRGGNNNNESHANSWSSNPHYSRNVAAAAAMTVAGVFLANRLKVKCSSCKRTSRNTSLLIDDTSNTDYSLA